jgi:hypothetical protein
MRCFWPPDAELLHDRPTFDRAAAVPSDDIDTPPIIA